MSRLFILILSALALIVGACNSVPTIRDMNLRDVRNSDVSRTLDVFKDDGGIPPKLRVSRVYCEGNEENTHQVALVTHRPTDPADRYIVLLPNPDYKGKKFFDKDMVDLTVRLFSQFNYINPGSAELLEKRKDSEGNEVTLVQAGMDWAPLKVLDVNVRETDDDLLDQSPLMAVLERLDDETTKLLLQQVLYEGLTAAGDRRAAQKNATDNARTRKGTTSRKSPKELVGEKKSGEGFAALSKAKAAATAAPAGATPAAASTSSKGGAAATAAPAGATPAAASTSSKGGAASKG